MVLEDRDPSTWFFFASEEEQALRMTIFLLREEIASSSLVF